MRKNIRNRYVALFLALALLLPLVPGGLFGLTASAATGSAFERVADHESIDYWKGYFSDGRYNSSQWSNTISTKNAGAVWTDKSVFVPESDGTITIDGVEIPLADAGDNFLVSMSVMASNKTVKGYEYIPTSTMLVLDVSASMGDGQGGNRSWDEMVQAANKAIDKLLKLNGNNLVGVVLYSGNTSRDDSTINHSTLLLPLDRYTTTAVNNNGTNQTDDDYAEYLTANTSGGSRSVGVSRQVSPSSNRSKNVSGGTYIQGGLYRAMQELISQDAPKKVESGVQAGMAYTPIVVLMSDGAPTAANLDYDFNGTDQNHETDLGDGTSTNERMGFLTQLTASYAKARIDEVYEKDTLFYTLGLGLNSLNSTDESIAEAVLDPGKNTGNMNSYWSRYLALNTTNNNTMYLNQNNGNPVVKSKYVTAAYKNYVTRFFEAVATQNTSLEQALLDAFEKIVDAIVLQSVYYPTEIESKSADLGGYVTFRDELGEYIDVKNVKGILFESKDGNDNIVQTLHTGANLAKNFVPGGGDLGQSSDPKPLGDELVHAVKERLGITETLTAQNLIRNAYYYGQLAYKNDSDFSNYIGYYGDANGNYVDFWHEGHTESEEQAAIAKGAKFIYQSYGYLGEVNEQLGIKASDMMYTSVQVRKTIASDVVGSAKGEIVVEGSIPASLIPTITYEVTLKDKDYDSGVQSLAITETSAKFPARLLYEVGLRSDINPINIAEKLGTAHKNANGTYTFFTNDWEFVDYENGAVADTSVNAFTHFEPAHENERYYYLTDSVVYTDDQGTEYTGTTAPAQTPSADGYYHAYRVFSVTGSTVSSEIIYIKTSPDALSHAKQQGGKWVIPAGTGKHEIVGYQVPLKNENHTQTNRFTAYPKIKTEAESIVGVHSHHYSVVTFGNNGRLTVTPATGIKISKALDIAASTARTFEFKISGQGITNGESYILTPVDADGNFGTAQTVTASSGTITVPIEAGASVYVTGLPAGDYTVTESEHDDYRVLTVNGLPTTSNRADITVASQRITEVSFVNTLKGFGSLYITKEVLFDTALPSHAESAEFDILVSVGTALAGKTFAAAHSANASFTEVTVNQSGNIEGLKLKHGETIVIRDLPENTNAVVTELLSDSQDDIYTPSYTSHNKAGETMDNDGSVIITKDANATVVVLNTYKPLPTDGLGQSITFNGVKTMDPVNLQNDRTFYFDLEVFENGSWIPVSGWNASATVSPNQSGHQFDINFNNFRLDLHFDEVGVHSYRIKEHVPENDTSGITYDPAIHTFIVTVTDNNGQLEASVSGNTVSSSAGGFAVQANFKNSYNTAPVIIDVEKKVSDATKQDPSLAGYEFKLFEADSSWNYNPQTDLVDTNITDQHGDTRFSWLVDSSTDWIDAGEKEKTYYYVLVESVPAGYVDPTDENYFGWNYDAEERHITVVVSVDDTGKVSAKIDNLAPDTASSYLFENVYKAKEVTVSLDGIATKTLNGRDQKAGEFTFHLTAADGQLLAVGQNTAAAEDGQTSPIRFFKPGSSEEFKLSYATIGTWHYKISEYVDDNNRKGGVAYTTRVFDLVVEVTDDGNGALQARYYFEDSTQNTVNFVNTYSVQFPTSIQLEGTKRLTGDRNMLAGEFHFRVFEMTDSTFADKKYQDPVATGENLAASPDANGIAQSSFLFTEITYTRPGTHYYRISEVVQDENNLGISYDTDPKDIVVIVRDNLDGTITASVVENESEAILFENTYTPKPTSIGLSGEKTLTGRTLEENEFEFALFEATVKTVGGKVEWTAGKKIGETVKNAENGNIVFPEVEFTAKGTYHYIAREVIGTKGGVTYDENEFHITFNVTDNFRGDLTVNTLITDQKGELSQIVFNNGYQTEDAYLTLTGSKVLHGKDLTEGEFSFVIKEGETVVANGKNNAAKEDAAAEIVFESIRYTMDDIGTHTYTVQEVIPEEKGRVTYDETLYSVSVEVRDGGNGKLLISDPVITKQGETRAVNTIAFENTYTPKPSDISVDIAVQKTVVNQGSESIGPEDFEFLLENITAQTKLSAKTNAEGKAGFTLTFSEEDIDKTVTYKLTEVNTEKEHVQYSTAEYTLTATVSLGADNKLRVALTQNGQAVNSVIAEFENVYDYTPVSVVPDNPATGDSSNPILWMALLFVSGAGLVGTTLFAKKRKEDETI